MLEEENRELERCSQEEMARKDEKAMARAEKEKDVEFIRGMLVEIGSGLKVLQAARRGDDSEAVTQGEPAEAAGKWKEFHRQKLLPSC